MGSTSTCLLNVDGPLTSPWTSSVATAKAFHTVRLTMTHKLRPPAQTGAAARPLVLSVNHTPDSPRSAPKPAPSPGLSHLHARHPGACAPTPSAPILRNEHQTPRLETSML